MADLGILAAEIPTELANRIPNQPTHVSVNFDNRAGMARSTYPKVIKQKRIVLSRVFDHKSTVPKLYYYVRKLNLQLSCQLENIQVPKYSL